MEQEYNIDQPSAPPFRVSRGPYEGKLIPPAERNLELVQERIEARSGPRAVGGRRPPTPSRLGLSRVLSRPFLILSKDQ